MQYVKHLVRSAFGKAGFTIMKTAQQSYGIDLWRDLIKLSTALNRPIELVFDVGANVGYAA